MTSTTSRSETDEEKWFFGKITSNEANKHLIKGRTYFGFNFNLTIIA